MGFPHNTMDNQPHKAFAKQPHMFAGKCRKLSRGSKKGARYTKSPGLGFKVPATAVSGKFIDKKCPFTGDVSIRGKIIRGRVISAGKMTNTITVRRDYLDYIRQGDEVTLGQCRPLCKTVTFNVCALEKTAD